MLEDTKSSSTNDILKLMEEELLRISCGKGSKRVIVAPDWLCKMIEESVKKWQK